jgi:hypothetical protein
MTRVLDYGLTNHIFLFTSELLSNYAISNGSSGRALSLLKICEQWSAKASNYTKCSEQNIRI